MTFLEIARRWTILILAETLKVSVSAIEAVLPAQPRWLAQIGLLASQLRAAADRDTAWEADEDTGWDDAEDEDKGTSETAGLPNFEIMLASHTCLRQGLSDIVARGLALDEELLQRMRDDWSADSIVSYLCSAEKNLRDGVNLTLDQAADSLGMSVATMTALAGCEPAAVDLKHCAPKAQARPAPAPVWRSGSAQ